MATFSAPVPSHKVSCASASSKSLKVRDLQTSQRLGREGGRRGGGREGGKGSGGGGIGGWALELGGGAGLREEVWLELAGRTIAAAV